MSDDPVEIDWGSLFKHAPTPEEIRVAVRDEIIGEGTEADIIGQLQVPTWVVQEIETSFKVFKQRVNESRDGGKDDPVADAFLRVGASLFLIGVIAERKQWDTALRMKSKHVS